MSSVVNPANINPQVLGSLVTCTAPGVSSLVAPGTDTQVLIANSGASSGINWSPIAGAVNTWTPTVMGATTAGTASYGTRVGNIFTLGNMTILSANVNFTSFTGTGTMLFGLPITLTSTQVVPVGLVQFDGLFTLGINVALQGIPNTNTLMIVGYTAGTAVTPQLCVSNSNIRFTIIVQTGTNP